MHRPEPNFNVAAQVIKQAEQNPGNTAIIFEGKTTSYGEFATRVRKQAGLLRSRGVCASAIGSVFLVLISRALLRRCLPPLVWVLSLFR